MSRNVAADTLTEMACAASEWVGALRIRRTVAPRHWTEIPAYAAGDWVRTVGLTRNAVAGRLAPADVAATTSAAW